MIFHPIAVCCEDDRGELCVVKMIEVNYVL